MLSIIICSRDKQALSLIELNILKTAAVIYEVIAIDNSQGHYNICEAYNLGAAKAQYDLLCFMHEDIRFHTIGWGQIVARILADPTVGILGVAGSTYQPAVPGAWWWSGKHHQRMHILHSPPGEKPSLDVINPENVALADMAVLDGVWLCARRAVWENYPFDQATFREFHLYDIDFCTAIQQHYRVCLTYEIMLEHFSKGSVNEMWLRNMAKYQRKWEGKLPFGPAVLSRTEQRSIERSALLKYVQLLVESQLNLSVKLRYLSQLFTYPPITRDYFWLLRQAVRTTFK